MQLTNNKQQTGYDYYDMLANQRGTTATGSARASSAALAHSVGHARSAQVRESEVPS